MEFKLACERNYLDIAIFIFDILNRHNKNLLTEIEKDMNNIFLRTCKKMHYRTAFWLLNTFPNIRNLYQNDFVTDTNNLCKCYDIVQAMNNIRSDIYYNIKGAKKINLYFIPKYKFINIWHRILVNIY